MPARIQPLNIFIVYAHEDERFRQALEVQLAVLQRNGLIRTWNDRDINPGTPWRDEIVAELNTADIILLLVSAHFLASDFIQSVELNIAMGRHRAREAQVVPIILSPCFWERTDLAELQALPRGANPVTQWRPQRRAFHNIAEGIARVAEEISSSPAYTRPAQNTTEFTVPAGDDFMERQMPRSAEQPARSSAAKDHFNSELLIESGLNPHTLSNRILAIIDAGNSGIVFRYEVPVELPHVGGPLNVLRDALWHLCRSRQMKYPLHNPIRIRVDGVDEGILRQFFSEHPLPEEFHL